MRVLLEIKLSKQVLEPKDLPKLLLAAGRVLPPDTAGLEVILSGRLPVWAFVAIAHLYHPAKWVATYDPRLGGGVVAVSHVKAPQVGDVVPIGDGVEKVEVEVEV